MNRSWPCRPARRRQKTTSAGTLPRS